ncbi:hypothetical protein [uncultured Nitrosomonas sp.]|uniref:hypothetical protein n=1 Tax=uncultured Nitrosomonas sp. TaxID=156424 RepID=UPI00262373ED|nr:hypothetical protein [uncultured Nitrosomonas sp.]
MKSFVFFMSIMLALPAFAVEVAPRISDREIIESLAELKAGQKALEEKMDLRFTAVDQRFTAMQEQMDQRFEAVDRRLDFVQQLMLVTIAGIFGLIGFIIWDRYSTLRPMDMRLRRLEENLEHDLELQSPEGSKLTRMIHVLRELAKEDRKIASILRSFSLL